MRHVYGPVPSRRLGRSLGIDPIPFKTCNWNCVYCQLGATVPPVAERRVYVPEGEILDDVAAALAASETRIDWVSFVGSGEPTLHAGIGRLIRGVKALTSIPVAVITNGSLLCRPEVRDELGAADAVLPSVDAGSEALYLRINRPHASARFDDLVDGLVAFRESFTGRLWVETMLLDGVNDTEEALRDLAVVLHRIAPDAVHLNLPIRPPAEPWVRPAGEEGLRRARRILGGVAHVVAPAGGAYDLPAGDVVDAIADVVQRHPMSEDEVEAAVRQYGCADAAATLARLAADARLKVVERGGRRFWCLRGGRYTEERAPRGP